MKLPNHTELLTEAVSQLSACQSYKGLYHQHKEGIPLPSAGSLKLIIDLARSVIFPGYFGNSTISSHTLGYHIGVNVENLHTLLTEQIMAAAHFDDKEEEEGVVQEESDQKEENKKRESTIQPLSNREHASYLAAQFVSKLPELRRILATDVEAAYYGDPAATSFGEIICCYPAIRAISNYRIAHELLLLGIPLIPRIMTEMAHSETGIDIHPGAQIGSYFTIDHGTGVVIGATSIIGNHVKLYQGVTLGAKSFPMDENGNPIKGIPRHPILEDEVVVYSNATILGRITIGKGATVGGNIWVTEDVAPGVRIVQKREEMLK
ncbi:MAG: serine O-acetyltransferase [Phocaeicola sp.]